MDAQGNRRSPRKVVVKKVQPRPASQNTRQQPARSTPRTIVQSGPALSTGFECPYCFMEIPRASTRCRHCGGALKNGKKVKKKTVVPAAHFFNILASIVCFFMLALPFLWGGLYFVAFILAIVGIVQGRVGSGIMALLGSIIMPWVWPWACVGIWAAVAVHAA